MHTWHYSGFSNEISQPLAGSPAWAEKMASLLRFCLLCQGSRGSDSAVNSHQTPSRVLGPSSGLERLAISAERVASQRYRCHSAAFTASASPELISNLAPRGTAGSEAPSLSAREAEAGQRTNLSCATQRCRPMTPSHAYIGFHSKNVHPKL